MQQKLKGIATTAKLGGHPIHPMLIPFPIALLTATLASDLAYWASADPFWARGSFWLLAGALLMGAAAAAAGLADFLGNPRIRAIRTAWQHMIGNVVAVAIAVVNFILRWSGEAGGNVLPWGLVLSALTVLLLLYTGRKGGALVYHHRVGMHPEEPAARDAAPRGRS